MREIKFRAWNKELKTMNPVSALHFDKRKYNLMFIDSGWKHIPTKFELMQYTGLKDKNGVEIYEGDILHIKEFCDNEIDVEFISKVIFSNKNVFPSAFQLEEVRIIKGYAFISQSGEIDSEVEIIGNIYENSELIK